MQKPMRQRDLVNKLRSSQIPFEEVVKLKLNKSDFNQKKDHLTDKNLLYLTKSQRLKDLSEIDNEYHKLVEQKRQEIHARRQIYKDLQVKLSENRNENVVKLLNDIKNKPELSIEPLKESLKQELDIFFNQSSKITTKTPEEKSRLTSNYQSEPDENNDDAQLVDEWNFVTINSDYKENFEINGPKNPDAGQLEQKYEHLFQKESDSTRTNSKLSSELSSSKSRLVSPKRVYYRQLTKSTEPALKTDQDHIETAVVMTNNNYQISLVEPSSNSLALINKKLESLQKIQLPSFQKEFHQVCQYADDTKMISLISDNIEYDANRTRNDLGRLGIHECCINGNFKMLKAILEYTEDLNVTDKNGQTAAHICAKNGELECLKLLAANGANLTAQDKKLMQLSHLAAQYNHSNVLEFLFQMGISLKVQCCEGKYPIHYAAEYGSFDALKLFTEYYVDVSLIDHFGNCAAHSACINDNLRCLKYLIKIGIPINLTHSKTNRTFAHYCCIYNSIECLHWLLINGIDPNALDNDGYNLAHISCLHGSAECLNCSIQHDVDLNAKNNNNETPYGVSRRAGKSLHIEKALMNQIKCPKCVKIALKAKWDKEHEKTMAEKEIEMNKEKFYRLNAEEDTFIKYAYLLLRMFFIIYFKKI